MANKMHPGAFRCYDAALPDEPIFVILGRDPAAPATIAYWASQRRMLGKNENTDDLARIDAARKEAFVMSDWREANLDPHGDGVPTWRLPRPEPEGERPIRMNPALGMPYEPDLRAKIAVGLRQVAEDLEQQWPASGEPPRKDDPMNQFLDRINGYALELETVNRDPYVELARQVILDIPKLEGGAGSGMPYDADKQTLKYTLKVAEGLLLECEEALRKTGMMKNFDLHERVGRFIRSYAKPVYWASMTEMAADSDGTLCKPLSVSRMCELLDYATAYGELDENTPDGTYAEKVDSAAMTHARRISIWTLKRCLGLLPENTPEPVADDTPPAPVQQVFTGNAVYRIPGVEQPQTTEQIAETFAQLETVKNAARRYVFATKNDDAGSEAFQAWNALGKLVGFGWIDPAKEAAAAKGVSTVGDAFREAGVAQSSEKAPTVDSKPDDLAHAPEVPAHRFSVFHEAGQYAYARGLEVNPIHLPMALDAMARSGWHLLTLFGQTDSQHIGFIFKRRDAQKLTMSIEGDPEKIREKLDLIGMGRAIQP